MELIANITLIVSIIFSIGTIALFFVFESDEDE